MNNPCDFYAITKELSGKQKKIVSLLYMSSQRITRFIHVKNQLLNLQDAGILEVKDDEVFLTELGINIGNEISDTKSSADKEESFKSAQARQARTEKSNHFLELYNNTPDIFGGEK